MTAPTDGELHFGRTHAPVGFTSAQVSQFDGSAEPVVRELIQNCLDAADRAGRPAQVRFIITDVSPRELPGWSQYCDAFSKAKSERQQRHTQASHDEKITIRRISQLISLERIPVLLCADNGCGVNPQQMISLLTVGNTDKGEGGAGSFGLGHHAAFGASDLRYVLYGSRYTHKGASGTISSGHAILATRTNQDGKLLAPEGYWRRADWKGKAWKDGSEFPTQVPAMLTSYLPETETGTVVAIAGFNDFHRETDEPSSEELIMQVAAANFCVAIDEERLKVEIISQDGSTHKADRIMLTPTLEKIAERKRAYKTGHISGAQAFAAWLTLRDGNELRLLSGVKIKWRPLDPARGEQTQVHLFRKGMWIDSRVTGLLKRDFSSVWPFDAVINLKDGELEKLVRASEGPEHRGIDRGRLDNEQKRLLREQLAKVADALRTDVGQRDDEEEYTPESFATLQGHYIRKAEPIRRPRKQGGGRQKTDVKGGKDRRNRGKGERRQGTPRPGSVPRYRHVLQSSTDAGTIEVGLQYEEDTKDGHTMGIRVRRSSGADGTCEQPLPDDYLRLVSVLDQEGRLVSAATTEGELELELPATSGGHTWLIELAGSKARELAAVPHLLSIDIVKRTKAPPFDPGMSKISAPIDSIIMPDHDYTNSKDQA
ncbi:hypothetical protein [Candidatus Poriferisocius sp.]|uniref:hypothetical protein n=1 Tax=Candidatus Poriferisocius sp. TaxID=3101276 RepID=UPI003B0208FB